MASIGNNTSGKISYIRDVFLNSEKEFVEELKQNSYFNYLVEKLKEFSIKKLWARVKKILNAMEFGVYIKPENCECKNRSENLLAKLINQTSKIKELNKDQIDLEIEPNKNKVAKRLKGVPVGEKRSEKLEIQLIALMLAIEDVELVNEKELSM